MMMVPTSYLEAGLGTENSPSCEAERNLAASVPRESGEVEGIRWAAIN